MLSTRARDSAGKARVMSSFIAKAACRGSRPSHLLSYRYYQRQRLVSRLLKERGVARFIIGPYGYGKTGLALEYADTIFGFAGVFWVNCKSPCFVRDLDEGSIAADCIRYEPRARLVVFEDVPFLDVERAEKFSREIDALLNRKCEVVVTCLPSSDALGRLQQDRVTVTAEDLLLDDEELTISHQGPFDAFAQKASIARSCRVPSLIWAQRQTTVREFLAEGFREEAPSDLLLALVCTAVLQAGSFAELSAMGPIDRDLIARFASSYPHLGFDDGLDAFEAPPFDVADIAFALRGTIDGFVKRSAYDSREAFVNALADHLIEAGGLERACDVVRLIGPRKARIAWIAERAYRLVAGSCFLPLAKLAASIRPMSMAVRQRSMLSVVEALCLCMLDDPGAACRHAKRRAFDDQVPLEYRIISLIVLAKCSSGALAERSVSELATIAAAGDRVAHVTKNGLAYVFLAQAYSLSSLDPQDLCELWKNAAAEGLPDDMLCIAASWFYDAYARRLGESEASARLSLGCDCSQIERFVRNRLGATSISGLGFFAASAGLAMEAAHVGGMAYYEGPLPTPTLIALRNVEMFLLAQRGRYAAESAQSAMKQDDWLATHPESALSPRKLAPKTQARLSVPTLSIKTFDRLEISIGGQLLDEDSLSAAHVRSLIVLLAENPGREISRDAICKAMWPDSSIEVSRKSFYSVWSKLKRALSLPDGSCPYLIRHRMGCSFDATLVKSDIARLDDICRAFMFEEPNFERWSDLLIEVDRDFSGDLMPSETTNALVVRARDEYRAKLVDALVAASAGMAQIGNERRAAWCAQMALDRDDTREDAYLALMRAQAASGQRVAAMATCRRGMAVLVDKLGLDPSPEMMEFYQQLLDANSER